MKGIVSIWRTVKWDGRLKAFVGKRIKNKEGEIENI